MPHFRYLFLTMMLVQGATQCIVCKCKIIYLKGNACSVTVNSHSLYYVSLIYISSMSSLLQKGNISFAQVLSNMKRLTMICRPFVEV